ncbi:hypothetical protein LPB19_00975 [Marinobacter salinisoli]|uniref:Uncharacterized protein n=1 Tax=Marinobacter salinisoli TaxID=2769486 RepID=A0ABX7MSA5_9GAMM|nr:hypothetical protein [Marinobacter salinisoli]QSP95029.1 hypothetical protein LPB19_00975 [Marinobacter salinisoli]
MALLVGVLSGCASHRYATDPAVAVSQDCDRQFIRWRNWVDTAGHYDAQDWSPPGFPYLRVDRFLAGFDLNGLSPRQRHDWLARAHQQAVVAWQFEAEGGLDEISQWLTGLRDCGSRAISELESEPELWHRLVASVEVPDSYSTPSQVIGVYPLVEPVVRWRAGVTMGELAAQFGDYGPRGGWRTYRPVPAATNGPDRLQVYPVDSLGVPVLNDPLRSELFLRHAPGWRIETQDSFDLPGVPGRQLDGRLQFRPEPVVFTHLSFTHFNGRILPQLNYVIWFSGRPAQGWLDIYAGALDGFVWRVTLDSHGRPLIYDTVHPCGCYHQWLLADGGLVANDSIEYETEQLWLLGSIPAESHRSPLLALSAGEHQLVGVSVDQSPAPDGRVQNYRLVPLDSLRGRSYAGGRLYDDDGLIGGTERLERFLLWPTGVASAGAMRQWGHHAVSFVGRRHFDDPHLLDRYFLAPQ